MSEPMKGLLEDLCAQMKIEDAATVVSSGIVEVNGVTIYVEGRDEVYSDEVLVYTDLGEIPQESAANIHRNLLEANLMWAGTGGATIGLHPDTGHAILAYQTPMAGLNGEGLAVALTQFSNVATYWQTFISSAGVVEEAVAAGSTAPDMMRV